MSSMRFMGTSPTWRSQIEHAIGRVFYHHGLFCASNPMLVLAVVMLGMSSRNQMSILAPPETAVL